MLHRVSIRAFLLVALALPAQLSGQDSDPHDGGSLWSRTLAAHFSVSADEVHLLSQRGAEANELAVVLFMAHRSGVSTDAVVAARVDAPGWDGVGRRFGLGAGTFHLPLARSGRVRALNAAYRRFEATPPEAWSDIRLTDDAIATLVNVRVISKALRLPPDDVVRELRPGEPYDQLFDRLVQARSPGDR